jgi:hypothetical protein
MYANTMSPNFNGSAPGPVPRRMEDGLSYHIDASIDFASPSIRRCLTRE